MSNFGGKFSLSPGVCVLCCVCSLTGPLLGRGGRIGTNLLNKGLISADRGTKATLTLTIPRSLFKSYAKDLSFPIFELVLQHRSAPNLWWRAVAVTIL